MKLYAKLISNKIIVYHKANLKKVISAQDVSKYSLKIYHNNLLHQMNN